MMTRSLLYSAPRSGHCVLPSGVLLHTGLVVETAPEALWLGAPSRVGGVRRPP